MAIKFNEFSNKLVNSTYRLKAALLESQIEPTQDREHFFSSDDFSVGKCVVSEGRKYEIIDKRSNYILLIDEHGHQCKKFPSLVAPTTESVQFADNTYKGVRTPEAFILIINESTISDVVAAINAIDLFNKKQFRSLFEAADKIGLNMLKLKSVSRAEQLQAIKIVSGALGIDTKLTDPATAFAEVKRKAASMAMTPDQKKIYADMLGMLAKLGISELVAETPTKNKVTLKDLDKKLTATISGTPVAHLMNPSNNTHRMQIAKKLMGD